MNASVYRCFGQPMDDDVWDDEEPQREALMSRGQGHYLFDDQGAKYIDCVNSTAIVGHCDPIVQSASCQAMSQLTPATSFSAEDNARYKELVMSTLPPHLDTILFCDSGSEAVDLAIRLSRLWCAQNTQPHFDPSVACGFPAPSENRENSLYSGGAALGGDMGGSHDMTGDVLVVQGSYHGCTNSIRALSNRLPKDITCNTDVSDRLVHVAPLPDVYRVTNADKVESPQDGGVSAAVKRHLLVTRQMLHMAEARGRKVSSFLCEPLLTIQGAVHPPPSWLQGMYRMVRELFGSLCIADEVQCGMGRLGSHFWGFQAQGVVPDIIVAGKSLGNGYPMAMVITSKKVSDLLGSLKEMYFCSDVHNAIGSAMFDALSSNNMMEKAVSTGRQLHGLLSSLKKKHTYVGDVRGVGLLHSVEIVWSQERKSPSREIAEFLVHRLRRRGVVIVREGINKNVLVIMPPMTFDDLDAASLVTKLDEALNLVSHNFNKKWGTAPSSRHERRDKDSDGDGTQGPRSSNGNHFHSDNNFNSRNGSFSSNLRDSSGFNSPQSNGHSGTSRRMDYNSSPGHSKGKSSKKRNHSDSLGEGPSASSNDNRKGSKRNIFSNIVLVERNTPNTGQNVLDELQSSSDTFEEPFGNAHPEYDRSKMEHLIPFYSADGDDMSAMPHPDELPRNSAISSFGMGMMQPQSVHQSSPYFCGLFPYEEIDTDE